MTKAIFQIEGMTCQHCAQTIEKTLEKLPGLQSVHVDLNEKQARVDYQGTLNAQAVIDAVEAEGYKAIWNETQAASI
jgi:copper ion binding protein